MSRFDSWQSFWKWRPVEIFQCRESIRDIIIYPHIKFFQNGHHNTAQIQHCPISTTFHRWVDYDVLNWFLTSKNFYWSPFSKWLPYLCGIVVTILKMATGRNFSMLGIISGHHYLPTYELSLKSDNVESVRYCGGHFEALHFKNDHHNTAKIQ
jgi:hypothetical protein